MKTCPKCLMSQSEDNFFYRNASHTTGRQSYCKICLKKNTKQWRNGPAGRAANRIRLRKRRTGFTIEIWNKALDLQEGRCGVCCEPLAEMPRTPHADHDHLTNTPRGILCHQCNAGIGYLADNPERCRAAALYLERPPLTIERPL